MGQDKYGLLVKKNSENESLLYLPVISVVYRIKIIDVWAEIEATQLYKNSAQKPLETIFVLPLIPRATLAHLEVATADTKATLKLREAQKDSPKIQSFKKEAHLDFLTADIGLIRPGDEVTVKLNHLIELTVENDEICFILPSLLHPPSFFASSNPELGYPVRYELEIEMATEIERITCPTYPSIEHLLRNCNSRQATFQALVQRSIDDSDFRLLIQTKDPHGPRVWIEQLEGHGLPGTAAFSMVISPQFEYPSLDTEIIFAIDFTSGYFSTSDLHKLQRVLQLFLGRLPHNSVFNMVSFCQGGVELKWLFAESLSTDDVSLGEALNYVKEMPVIGKGGSLSSAELSVPLQVVVERCCMKSGAKPVIFLFSDGNVENTEEVFQTISKLACGVRIFTFAVAPSANYDLLQKITRVTGGFVETTRHCMLTASLNEDALSSNIVRYMKEAQQPCIGNLKIQTPDNNLPYISRVSSLPCLLSRSASYTLYGLLNTIPDIHIPQIVLTGNTIEANPKKVSFAVDPSRIQVLRAKHICRFAVCKFIRDYEEGNQSNSLLSELQFSELQLGTWEPDEITRLCVMFNFLSRFVQIEACESPLREDTPSGISFSLYRAKEFNPSCEPKKAKVFPTCSLVSKITAVSTPSENGPEKQEPISPSPKQNPREALKRRLTKVKNLITAGKLKRPTLKEEENDRLPLEQAEAFVLDLALKLFSENSNAASLGREETEITTLTLEDSKMLGQFVTEIMENTSSMIVEAPAPAGQQNKYFLRSPSSFLFLDKKKLVETVKESAWKLNKSSKSVSLTNSNPTKNNSLNNHHNHIKNDSPSSELNIIFDSYSTAGAKRTNEDRIVGFKHLNELFGLKSKYRHSFFAVYDGHLGSQAAEMAKVHLHRNIARDAFFEVDLFAAFSRAFQKTHMQVVGSGTNAGTTASAILLRDDVMIIGYAGDSQAVLSTNGIAHKLIDPHTPVREDEQRRIKASGGCVVWYGTHRVNGVLAVSRSIGDAEFGNLVPAEPDLSKNTLSSRDEFIVLATDGLWDVFQPQQAVDFVKACVVKTGSRKNVARFLIEEALNRRSQDNISVIIIYLNISTSPASLQYLTSTAIAKNPYCWKQLKQLNFCKSEDSKIEELKSLRKHFKNKKKNEVENFDSRLAQYLDSPK